jgi:uncharacterized protein YjbI with pentapeptide repeats
LFLDKTPTISGVSDPKEASERQRVALLFLVNAVAVERDTTVQSAILDNLSSLSRFDMPSAVLNEALVAARNRNRGILTTLRDRFNERSLENNKSLIEEAVDEAFLGKLNESELLPLKGTAATIAALIRNGAYTSDLTRIYCMGCDFSSDTKPVDLSGVKFDLSYLRDAKFKNVNLVAASFDTAFLIYTDFTGANLRGARLTSSTLVNPPIQAILVKKALWGAYGPIFECADLTDSDFTGSVLFGFYWTEVGNTGYFPRFYKADLTRTNMKSIEVFTAIPKGVLNRLAKTEPQLRVSDLVLGLVEGGAYPILVRGWMGTNDYEIRTLSFGAFTRPIPKEIWPSVYAGLNSLSSGDNLAKAQLPTGLQDFLTANAKVFAKPIISTTCPEKR